MGQRPVPQFEPWQPPSPHPSTSLPALVPMQPTGADTSLTAAIAVTGTSAGTRIDGTCTYVESSPYQEAGNYTLWVVAKSGKRIPIDSWHAIPGATVPLVGQTWWPMDQLKRIEMHDSNGKVVLYYDL